MGQTAFPQDVPNGTEGKQEATNHLIRRGIALLAAAPRPKLARSECGNEKLDPWGCSLSSRVQWDMTKMKVVFASGSLVLSSSPKDHLTAFIS